MDADVHSAVFRIREWNISLQVSNHLSLSPASDFSDNTDTLEMGKYMSNINFIVIYTFLLMLGCKIEKRIESEVN